MPNQNYPGLGNITTPASGADFWATDAIEPILSNIESKFNAILNDYTVTPANSTLNQAKVLIDDTGWTSGLNGVNPTIQDVFDFLDNGYLTPANIKVYQLYDSNLSAVKWSVDTAGKLTGLAQQLIKINDLGTAWEDATFKSGFALTQNDAYADFVSNEGGFFGSCLSLKEVQGTTFIDTWNLIRETSNGTGNGTLALKYGTNTAPSANPTRHQWETNGAQDINIPDNVSAAYNISEGATKYLNMSTLNGTELVDSDVPWLIANIFKASNYGSHDYNWYEGDNLQTIIDNANTAHMADGQEKVIQAYGGKWTSTVTQVKDGVSIIGINIDSVVFEGRVEVNSAKGTLKNLTIL